MEEIRITLRLPKELHEKLIDLKYEERKSLNAVIVERLEYVVKKDTA